MNLDIYNTHMELYPYEKGDYPIIENIYTAIDSFSGKEFDCGYLIDNNKLYLPKGTPISKIENLTGCVVKFINKDDPVEKMTRQFYPINDPRDHIQEESIKFLKQNEKQLSLNLLMGLGKMEPYSRKIPTPTGYTLMGDLKIGDKIFGSDGSVIYVEEIFENGIQDIYEIKFSDGRNALCGLEHLWKVYKNGKIKILPLWKILVGMDKNTYEIPTVSNYVQYDEQELQISPYKHGKYCKMYGSLIEDKYIFNSFENRIKLLNSFFENNDYCESNDIELLKKLQFLLRSLGYNGVIENDKISINYNNSLLKIESIKYHSRQKARCIRVSAEDSLYLTEDFIVTHNTYCVANASTALNEKVLIITPNESIKMQWINTFMKMFDYRSKNIMNISGSNIIEGIIDDSISIRDTCVFLVNHQTLHSYLFSNNPYKFGKFFKKIKIGIKVYDEAHLNFMNILLIDFFTNTKRTWYLTATFDRSSKSESECFKRAFNSVLMYGENESHEVVEKHVKYFVVNINSMIDPKNRARLMGFPGFQSNKFGKYAFIYDKNNTMYNSIVKLLNMTKHVEGKRLIFVPLIEAVDIVVEKLKKDFPEFKIGALHSKISAEEKNDYENWDVIVSTIKSSGTGKDIKDLRIVINSEAYSSKVLASQVVGRLRNYYDKVDGVMKETYFFDIVDICIPHCNYYFKARFKRIQTLVKEVNYLDINNTEE